MTRTLVANRQRFQFTLGLDRLVSGLLCMWIAYFTTNRERLQLGVGLLEATSGLEICTSYICSFHHQLQSPLAPMKPEWKTFWYWLTQVKLEMADKMAFTNYKKHIPSSGKLGTSSSNKSCKINSTANNISFGANGKHKLKQDPILSAHFTASCKFIHPLYRCGSGCVVECRICNWEAAGSNLGRGYFAPRSTQPSIPPGSVNEYQL